MRIYLRLEGGLGNQLFQYAHARKIQEFFGGNIILDLHAYNKKQIRSLSLQHFSIPAENYSSNIANRSIFILSYFRLLNRVAFLLQKSKYSSYLSFKIFCKLGLCQQYKVRAFNSLVKPKIGRLYVSGNWMSPLFFGGIESILKKEFQVKTKLNNESLQLLNIIQTCNSVCIHVRLGDYLSPEWIDKLYLCTEDYYQKSIDFISSKIEEPVFFLFSNRHADFVWIKENYHLRGNIIYADLSNPDYADFQLMYNCKHFIMSNSTYSWWAQWLGSYKDKIVIAPSRFNKIPEWDMTDLYLKDWKIINV